MRKKTAKAAYREHANLERLMCMARKKQCAILKAVPMPFAIGSIIRAKNEFTGYKYYTVTALNPWADNKRKLVRFSAWGYLCTKDGNQRARTTIIGSAFIERAEVFSEPMRMT